MIRKEVVGDSNSRGSLNHVDKPIVAPRKRAVVDPHMRGREHSNGVPIGASPETHVADRAHDHPFLPGPTVPDPDPVHDHVTHALNRQARPVPDLDPRSPSVDGLEAVHDQLVLEPYHHVPREHDPQRLGPCDAVSERPAFRVRRIVRGARHGVDFPVLSPDRCAAEPDRALG